MNRRTLLRAALAAPVVIALAPLVGKPRLSYAEVVAARDSIYMEEVWSLGYQASFAPRVLTSKNFIRIEHVVTELPFSVLGRS